MEVIHCLIPVNCPPTVVFAHADVSWKEDSKEVSEWVMKLIKGFSKFLVLEWVIKRIKNRGFSKCVGVSFGGFEEEAMWLVAAIEKRWRNNEATFGSKK